MLVTDPDARSTPDVTRSEPRESADPLSASGFRARLDGLSLFDLIQMECLARARRVVRVGSAGKVGYLFFKDGDIFHAATKNLTGERAALEMLEWTDGTFEPCNVAWPEKGSVRMGWQNLLLGAATAKDEHAAGKLVHLPNRRLQYAEPESEEDVTSDAEELSTDRAVETTVNSKIEKPAPKGVQRAVRIDSTGNVLSGNGDIEELAGFAAYASRVGELIGQALGLGRFSALNLAFDASRSILCVQEGGQVVVLEAKNADDLTEIARSAGL